ncbi:host specificity protein [Zhengella mangrovi]|uniref:Host specificity protein n=1 Tax=Zhengella mangrovi TaxID=1982044 RepID=A0A2G1QS28_9HYPH|nr:glycoside hydrolase/phage tail family protein [Zhengella mangrovi]PHP68347.1 host specificity protein [Zhengella mangrovi]
MATILLQAAGAFVGGFLGPVGAAVGSAAGAMAGYAVDNALIQSTRRYEGARLPGMQPFQAEEGAVLPQVFGAARVSGTMIWATRFEERSTTRRQGLKGGPRVTEYSYFANVAFALCEGPVAGIRRVWADGRELDLSGIDMRVYTGSQDQLPDPLIEAKQGYGNAPAYRGTAYVVFERLPLDGFGNRVPQLQFEVLAPAGDFHRQVRAVALIPGSTEYGLSPTAVRRQVRPGQRETLNRHVLHGESDFSASIDELQALCPNLETVALVVAWFGTDLRAGHCRIVPGVTEAVLPDVDTPWQVAGLTRDEAHVVSRQDGGPAYGGTPSDASVIAAIRDLTDRGIRVAFYPFLMMDIPPANGLPDPWGGGEQAAYPWRGRITASLAPGRDGSPDSTAAVRAEIAGFLGRGEGPAGTRVDGAPAWAASANTEGYRRMILHYAMLCAGAGGVDAFLVGSELRGLTALRDDGGVFPFVHGLRELAREVKAILGAGTGITYGADWSEYFGLRPADGSGDVFYNLDDLWMDGAIDAVGIDNYMPLSDWRDADWAGGNPDGARSPHDAEALAAAISGGEGFDWYYADDEARAARSRTPITDGAHGKDWVYRYKDIAGWWSNVHVERRGGQETGRQSPWVPGAKPVWFTELGCPAIDKGANQPNVFVDAKSSENAVPHFSSGGRDSLAQRRFLQAHYCHWQAGEAANPLSPLTGRPMVDSARIYCWAWDARPFPAFPRQAATWADGGNWARGHWLNGRVEDVEIGDVINAVLSRHGVPPADVGGVDALAGGIVLDSASSARDALEPLVAAHGLTVDEAGGSLAFRSESRAAEPVIVDDCVETEGDAVRVIEHAAAGDRPREAVIAFRDPFRGYETAVARVEAETRGTGEVNLAYPGILHQGTARALASGWLSRLDSATQELTVTLPPASGIEVGAPLQLAAVPGRTWLVTSLEEGLTCRLKARRINPAPPQPDIPVTDTPAAVPFPEPGAPQAIFLDLPMGDAMAAEEEAFRVAVWSDPWRTHAVEASPETTGYDRRTLVTGPAAIGTLLRDLAPGRGARRERRSSLDVAFVDAEPESVTALALFGGANAMAVGSPDTGWEILQFQHAEEIRAQVWRLSCLLRGQLGTEDRMALGAPAGSHAVLLDETVRPAGLRAGEVDLPLQWRVRPLVPFAAPDTVTGLAARGGTRALTPLSPVHVRCAPAADGGRRFRWTRRSRIRADTWDAVPLGEDREDYRVLVRTPDGKGLWETEVAGPACIWPGASIAGVIAAGHARVIVEVRQAGGPRAWGLPATRAFDLPHFTSTANERN